MLTFGLGRGISLIALVAFLLLFSPLLMETAFGQSPPTPGWYRNNGNLIIHEDNSLGLRIVWEKSYIYQHPGTDNLYWYAQVKYLNEGSKLISLTCPAGLTDALSVKEHIRGTEGIPRNGDGVVAAEETFCNRNPTFSRTLNPGETNYDWAIFHNVPPGGEVRLEWGSYGFSAWVDPWYSPYSPDVPPPAECPHELVTLGTCVIKAVPLENPMKQLVDLVGDVVSGSKAACDIVECETVIQYPLALLDKIFTVGNLGIAMVQEVIFGDKLKTLNQAIREHGLRSPQTCQAAKEVINAVRDLHKTLLSVVPPLGLIFPLPQGEVTKCRS